jgi:hypothetical protein
MATINSMMGFNGNLFERASDEDIETKIREQKLEFLWEPEFQMGVFPDSIFTKMKIDVKTNLKQNAGFVNNKNKNK